MTKLSVNINKIAVLRNSRGANMPDVIQAAIDCESFGADGITVHPRPDERHIRYDDVRELKKVVQTELNVEGNPFDPFLDLVLETQPHQVTLVPDPPGALTSNSGWDVKKHQGFLQDTIGQLKAKGIRTSIFLDPIPEHVAFAKSTGTDRIELYTELYAQKYNADKHLALQPYLETAVEAQSHQLGLNAGHDLNLDNLQYFYDNIPGLQEVSIGHALVCDALYKGLEATIHQYLYQIK